MANPTYNKVNGATGWTESVPINITNLEKMNKGIDDLYNNTGITPDQTQAPAANGTLFSILNFFAALIKGITGKANWYTAPDTTLSAAKTHMDANAPHTGHINHSLASTANDFLVASGVGVFVRKTLAEVKTILGLGSAAGSAISDFAPANKGVTNGDSHDHNGGDGAQISHANLSALTSGDPHTQYVRHGLATAVNDFLVASGAGAFIKKTLAETKAILGVASASETAQGIIEIATQAEVTTGIDTARAVVPAYLKTELDKKMGTTKLYGQVSYTDAMTSGTEITKLIALGSSTYKHGMMTIYSTGGTPAYALLSFGTNSQMTVYTRQDSTTDPVTISTRRRQGGGTKGMARVGQNNWLKELYINGSNIQMLIRAEGSNSLTATIDWEVW